MKSEFSNKASEMRTATIDEAAQLLRTIAGNRRADESLKAVFNRLRRQLTDWSDNRIRDVWHRDQRVRVRAEEVEQLRALALRRDRRAADNELQELRTQVEQMQRRLERIDPTFHSETIAALGHQRREMGGSSRAPD